MLPPQPLRRAVLHPQPVYHSVRYAQLRPPGKGWSAGRWAGVQLGAFAGRSGMCIAGSQPTCTGWGLCPRTSARFADFVCLGAAGPARGFVPACGGGLQGAQRTGNPQGACGAGNPQGACGGGLCRPKGLGSCISPGLCRTHARAASGLV